MLLASACYSNLLTILSDDDMLGTAVQELNEALKVMETEDIRGSVQLAALNPGAQDFYLSRKATRQALSPDYFDQLCNVLGQTNILNEVLSLDQIAFRGVCYGTFLSTHFRDSAIIFNSATGTSEGNSEEDRAGIIDMIFQCKYRIQGDAVEKIFIFVKEHPPVQRPDFYDPYRNYGFAAGRLCEGQTHTLHLVELTQVVCHFALTALPDAGLIHVMPVDRVSSSTLCWVCSSPILIVNVEPRRLRWEINILVWGREDCRENRRNS
jgi:hypothetical protein